MRKNKGYQNLYFLYDNLMGDQRAVLFFYEKLIKKYQKHSCRNILDLACGTGNLMNHLKKDYEIYGLDSSKEMLSIASKKINKKKLFNYQMQNFKLNRKFDVIFCNFDSINHLDKWVEWKKTFNNAHEHLKEDGFFIFDINTVEMLEKKSERDYIVNTIDKHYILYNINKEKNKFYWNFNIFKYQKNDNYKLLKDNVIEISFEIEKIIKELEKRFKKVYVINSKFEKHKDKNQRPFFICYR